MIFFGRWWRPFFAGEKKLNSYPFLMGARIIIGPIHHTQTGPLTKSTTKQSIA
jgi:hypothetical protein